jgi:hypothetical protein
MRFLAFSILLCCHFSLKGQQLLYKFPIKGIGENFITHTLGDSILLCYDAIEDKRYFFAKWILPDSGASLKSIPYDILEVAEFENTVYYYHVINSKKKFQIKALTQRKGENLVVDDSTTVTLPKGMLLGKYVNENLFIIYYDYIENSILVLEINRLSIVKFKRYKLSFPFSKYFRPDQVALVNVKSPISTFQGYQNFKVFVDSTVSIVCDINSYADQIFETAVLTLDPYTEEVTRTAFIATRPSLFSSWLLQGKLFRITVFDREYVLTIYDVKTKAVLSTKTINIDKQSYNGFLRMGRKSLIRNNLPISELRITKPNTAASLNVVATQPDQFMIQWGNYYDDNASAPTIINPVNPIASVVASAILIAATEMQDGPGLYRYSYLRWSSKTDTYEPIEKDPNFLRMKIDEYEVQEQSKGMKPQFKGYVIYRNGILATYYFPRKSIELIYFE